MCLPTTIFPCSYCVVSSHTPLSLSISCASHASILFSTPMRNSTANSITMPLHSRPRAPRSFSTRNLLYGRDGPHEELKGGTLIKQKTITAATTYTYRQPTPSSNQTPLNFPRTNPRCRSTPPPKNATIVTTELIHVLQHPAPVAPFSKTGNKQIEALQ